MTDDERSVIEEAIILVDALDAVDAGLPVQDYVRKSTASLRRAINHLHAENDGRYKLPEEVR